MIGIEHPSPDRSVICNMAFIASFFSEILESGWKVPSFVDSLRLSSLKENGESAQASGTNEVKTWYVECRCGFRSGGIPFFGSFGSLLKTSLSSFWIFLGSAVAQHRSIYNIHKGQDLLVHCIICHLTSLHVWEVQIHFRKIMNQWSPKSPHST